jgi:hypothetical protein
MDDVARVSALYRGLPRVLPVTYVIAVVRANGDNNKISKQSSGCGKLEKEKPEVKVKAAKAKAVAVWSRARSPLKQAKPEPQRGDPKFFVKPS